MMVIIMPQVPPHMRNVLNSKNMRGFLGLKLQRQIYKANKIIRMLVAIKYNST